MKRFLFSILFVGAVGAFSEASAQTTQSSTVATKDEFWGTAKTEQKGASAASVGKRSEGLDQRFNTYDDSRKRAFARDRVKNSKRMKEIEKKEKAMMRKHKRDKRRLRRSQL